MVGGGREVLHGHVRERLAHEVAPDRGRDRPPEDGRVALDELHRHLSVRIAHPDTGDELRRVAAEPRVLVVLRRARLARHRTADRRGGAGAVCHDALERRGDEVGVVGRHDPVAGRKRLAEDLAVRAAHHLERLGRVPDAVRRDRAVRGGHLER